MAECFSVTRDTEYLSVQDNATHSARDLHVRMAQSHSAKPSLVRDYLD